MKGKRLTVSVTNTGSCAGTAVVQLYVRRPDDAEGPLKTLRGFQRVDLAAGETAQVQFPLTPDTFCWWDAARQDMAPCRGNYELLVGDSSADAALQKINYKY